MSTYHVARNNQQLGTFSKEDIITRYANGEILPSDLVWMQGMANWEPALTVFGPLETPASAVPPSVPAAEVTAPSTTPPPVLAPVAGQAAVGNLPPKPENYLIFSILVTIFCCWPLGIPAIVYAAQVDGKYARGDYAGAASASTNAKTFTWLSFGIGFLILPLIIIVNILPALAGSM